MDINDKNKKMNDDSGDFDLIIGDTMVFDKEPDSDRNGKYRSDIRYVSDERTGATVRPLRVPTSDSVKPSISQNKQNAHNQVLPPKSKMPTGQLNMPNRTVPPQAPHSSLRASPQPAQSSQTIKSAPAQPALSAKTAPAQQTQPAQRTAPSQIVQSAQRAAGTASTAQRNASASPSARSAYNNNQSKTTASNQSQRNTTASASVSGLSKPADHSPAKVSMDNLGFGAAELTPDQKYSHTATYESLGSTGDYEIDDATYQRPTKRSAKNGNAGSSTVISLLKVIIYIICIIGVSVVLSIFVINTANDVFAFVKEENVITITIPEYATIDEIGDILGESGVIKYPWAFKLWSKVKERDAIEAGTGPEFVAGTYEVSTTLNYDYLRATFKKRMVRTEVRITIPEGKTVDEIIDIFIENGIGTREGFVKAINETDYNYRFINELEEKEGRIYRLEGYLFPDTYNFYSDATEAQAINKLLSNFDSKFTDEYYDRCAELNMSVNDVITLASMIEKEARYHDELGDVSSVFHNRLRYKSTFPYLESDATVIYAIAHDRGSRPETVTGEDMKYESPYNTYTNKGLPPGPIANPGFNSIKYALYPNDTNYFYFVSNSNGRMLFATTYAGHLKNIETARS